MKVTKKEYAFLKQISTSDFANESDWSEADLGVVGVWVGADWKVNKPTDEYNMKVVRGLMSSLQEKKVVELRREVYDEETWVCITIDYLDTENEKLKNLTISK